VRDRLFLTWRFVDCPLFSCRFFTLSGPRHDEIVAYAACAPYQRSLKIFDFLADPNVPGALTRLLLELSQNAYGLGYDSLAVEFFGDPATRHELQTAGLMVRDARPLYAGGAACHSVASHKGWHITCADEDW
jgi:hypothetical protein